MRTVVGDHGRAGRAARVVVSAAWTYMRRFAANNTEEALAEELSEGGHVRKEFATARRSVEAAPQICHYVIYHTVNAWVTLKSPLASNLRTIVPRGRYGQVADVRFVAALGEPEGRPLVLPPTPSSERICKSLGLNRRMWAREQQLASSRGNTESEDNAAALQRQPIGAAYTV